MRWRQTRPQPDAEQHADDGTQECNATDQAGIHATPEVDPKGARRGSLHIALTPARNNTRPAGLS
jgi:hypothetical protein